MTKEERTSWHIRNFPVKLRSRLKAMAVKKDLPLNKMLEQALGEWLTCQSHRTKSRK